MGDCDFGNICKCCEDDWVDPWMAQGICPFPPDPGTLDYAIWRLEPFDTPILNTIMRKEKE